MKFVFRSHTNVQMIICKNEENHLEFFFGQTAVGQFIRHKIDWGLFTQGKSNQHSYNYFIH